MPKSLKIFIHVLFWLFSIGIDFITQQLPYLTESNAVVFFTASFCIQCSYITYFYFNYLYLVPQFLIKKQYSKYLIGVGFNLIMLTLSDAFLWNNFNFNLPLFNDYQLKVYSFTWMYGLFISTGLSMFDYWMESEKQKQKLEQEVSKTELLFLQSQMSPHFLFNTLNNIYSLSLKKSNLTSVAIAQLKNMMQYFESFEKGEKISLEAEIEHIKSFIALNKMRYFNTINFEINGNIENQQKCIEPMLFIPFIENAFKHGDTSEKSTFNIRLNITEKEIHFSITNLIDNSKRKDKNGGIGIKNVQRRLQLLFPNKHHLHTEIIDNLFVVALVLKNE